MAAESWYSVRSLFRHPPPGSRPAAYEERIVLLRAVSFEDALRRAEQEARIYVAESTEGGEHLEFTDLYWLPDESIGDATEVFSLIRNSELEPKEYLSRYFPTDS